MLTITDMISLEQGPWKITSFNTTDETMHFTFQCENEGRLMVDCLYNKYTFDVFINHQAINLSKEQTRPVLRRMKQLIETHPSFRLLAVTNASFVQIQGDDLQPLSEDEMASQLFSDLDFD